MGDKSIWKILAILILFAMVGSCAAMPSAGDISESDRNSSSATIYVLEDAGYNVGIASATIIDHGMSRTNPFSLDIEKDFQLNRTTQFYTTDFRVIFWYEAIVNPEDTFIERWYDPDGNLYDESSDVIPSNVVPSSRWLHARKIPLEANLGEWHIDLYHNGELEFTEHFTISRGPPDLVITDIWWSGCTIFYKIKNQGEANAGASYTSLSVDEVFIVSEYVAPLGAGAERTENFTYNWTFTPPEDKIEVCADYQNDVTEINETNNCKSKACTYIRLVIYVPDDYATIQAAVNAASPGDTIIVRDGTYIENIEVDKSLTIQSENGSDSTIVQAKDPDDDVFEITADYVNISGFTVEGGRAALYLSNVDHSNISNNSASNNNEGIYLESSSNNRIINNIINSNKGGIELWLSSNNMVMNNTANLNKYHGIRLENSNNNTLTNNIASSNNDGGIELEQSSNNIVMNNTVNVNKGEGIYLESSSHSNTITNNTALNNDYGIRLEYSNGNLIHLNNFINNADNVYSSDSTNIWNSPSEMTYTYNGSTYTNYLGNYWSDYTGIDVDGDGIGETPYVVDLDKDYFPLTELWEIYLGLIPTPTPPTPTPSAEIYVPDDYATIQAAVNAASAGDIIIVRDGTYIENIKVDKNLTIRSENGPDSTIVRAEDPDDHVFEVTGDYVNISGFTVKGVTRWFSAGISLYYADYCNISNNNCSNNWCAGIYLDESNNNSISNNNCLNNHYGIYLGHSNHNSMLNNDCSNNSDGISLWYSNYNSISNNDCSNNWYAGIYLTDSNANKLTGNILLENGIVIWGYLSSHYEHEIDESNIVNGKPVYYWKNIEGGRIPNGAGQVILVNCKNVVVENQNLNNASIGIQIAYSSDITIKNNDCSNNSDGILLDKSNDNCISNNNCSNSWAGISLDKSNNNCISNNNCSNNWYAGIHLWASNTNKLMGNILLENGIVIRGYSLSHYEQEIDGSNTVNGKPIYYWKGIEGERIPDGATQVILVNCKNVVVENQNLNNASVGIQTAFSSYITIKNNTCSNNDEGIYLGYSTNNSISNNNCSSNNWVGIYLENSNHSSISNNNCLNNWHGIYLADSTNNHIYLNNFINHADNICSYSSHNIWNSPSRITYTYNETTYTNYLGNYWDDYEGTDADEDGIGDISYSIDTDWYSQLGEDTDWYPLMKPWENYFALPMPGEWRGSAEFGEFVFIVNNSSTGISKISYNFSNWTCGPITRSGGVSIGPTHWPITSGQFTIETDLGGTLPMTIRGKFDETGTHASGNWEAVSSGVTCSGAWDADYNSNEKSNT